MLQSDSFYAPQVTLMTKSSQGHIKLNASRYNFCSLPDAVINANLYDVPEYEQESIGKTLLEECKRILSQDYYCDILKKYDMDVNDAIPILIITLGPKEFSINPLSKINKGLVGHATNCTKETQQFLFYLFRSLELLPKVNATTTTLYSPSIFNAVLSGGPYSTLHSNELIIAYKSTDNAEKFTNQLNATIHDITGNCVCYDISDFSQDKKDMVIIKPSVCIQISNLDYTINEISHVPITVNKGDFVLKDSFEVFLSQNRRISIVEHMNNLFWEVYKDIISVPKRHRPLTHEEIEYVFGELQIVNVENTILRLVGRFFEVFNLYGISPIRVHADREREQQELLNHFLSLIKTIHTKGKFGNKLILTLRLEENTPCPYEWINTIGSIVNGLCNREVFDIESYVATEKRIDFVAPEWPISLMDMINSKPDIVPGCRVEASIYDNVVVAMPFDIIHSIHDEIRGNNNNDDDDDDDDNDNDDSICDKLLDYLNDKMVYPTTVITRFSKKLNTKLFILSLKSVTYFDSLKRIFNSAYICPVMKLYNIRNNVVKVFGVLRLWEDEIVNINEEEDKSLTITLISESSLARTPKRIMMERIL